MEVKGRSRGAALLAAAVVCFVIVQLSILGTGLYGISLAVLWPVCLIMGVAYLLVPSLDDEPRDQKHNVILWGSCAVGVLLGAANLYFMGFFR